MFFQSFNVPISFKNLYLFKWMKDFYLPFGETGIPGTQFLYQIFQIFPFFLCFISMSDTTKSADQLRAEIAKQGEFVKNLKTTKAAKVRVFDTNL